MKHEISLSKQQLRTKIAAIKRNFSAKKLEEMSFEVISRLEQTDEFKNADVLFIYYSIEDEVCTRGLIEKYIGVKRIVLPVVRGNELLLRELGDTKHLEIASYGISEPKYGTFFGDYSDIDIAVIPGVAFDRKMHRLGRGKGFYDRLLSSINACKTGICFDFQLRETIPFDATDVTMDRIISQSEDLRNLNIH